MEKEQDILFDNIELSLRYGVLRMPKELLILLWIVFIACGVGEIACLLAAILYNQTVAVVMIFVFIAIALICIIVCMYFRRRKTKAKLWLGDAVQLKAKCTTLAKMPQEAEMPVATKIAIAVVSVAANAPIDFDDGRYPSPRILITFKHNGKVIKRMSGKQGYSDEEMETGRQQIFKRYIGKEVDILYSPKYDEVLLLKLKDE